MDVKTVMRNRVRKDRSLDRRRKANERRPLDPEYSTVSEFRSLLEEMRSQRKDPIYWRKVKNVLAQGEDFILAFVTFPGAKPKLMTALVSTNPLLQVEAAGCIANVASNEKFAPHICKLAAAYLVTFLGGYYSALQDSAAVALGNLASSGCCEQLAAVGFLFVAVQKLESPYSCVVESCLFAIERYTSTAVITSRDIEKVKLLESLLMVMKAGYLKEPCQILFNLYARVKKLNADDLSQKICQRVLESYPELDCKSLDDIKILTPMQRCLAAMAATSAKLGEQVAQKLLEMNVLYSSLTSPFSHYKKECLWLINNITPWIPSLDEATSCALADALYTYQNFTEGEKLPFAENILRSPLGSCLVEYTTREEGEDIQMKEKEHADSNQMEQKAEES